jgi:hypothetical protein
MFESEVEMEKRSASWVPLLFILGLVACIVGVAGYYYMQVKRGLSQEEASSVVSAVLKAQGPAAVEFHTGLLTSSVADRPSDPQYKLLEKAGLMKLGKATSKGTLVTLTDAGEAMLAQIPGVEKGTEKDGTTRYRVPLAERKLLQVSSVTMSGPSFAKVEYTWKWEPNRLGEVFDASGEMVRSFKTWDRANLIEKHGADFFHGAPKLVSLSLMRGDKGWQIPAE